MKTTIDDIKIIDIPKIHKLIKIRLKLVGYTFENNQNTIK